MELSLLDIYRIGRDAVRFFPAQSPPIPCLQLQAFRVLQRDRDSELDTDTLGAVPTDKDSPFFWSRKWANTKFNPNALGYDPPFLTMFEVVNTFERPAFEKGNRRCYALNLTVWDKYKEECTLGNHTGCESRPANQIYVDTGILLDTVLHYIGQTVIAYTSADPVEKVYYKPYLDFLKLNGDITSFDIVKDFQESLNGHNKQNRFVRVERTTSKMFGTSTQINFCTTNCPTIEYDNTLPDFGTMAWQAGCSNC